MEMDLKHTQAVAGRTGDHLKYMLKKPTLLFECTQVEFYKITVIY